MSRRFPIPALILMSMGLPLSPAMAEELAPSPDLFTTILQNPTAYIPSQCYTKTVDAHGDAHNPCQTCHTFSRSPNFVVDADLQQSYALPGPALKNPWTNLFVDRSAAVAATDPAEIDAWVNTDNYMGADGRAVLAKTLEHVPAAWDVDHDGHWSGYLPDAQFRFDEEGFDIGADGRMTGWRAFAYQPLPGTFWPTNGSGDDVLIRLPAAFQERADGTPDLEIYKINLAITEALIRQADVTIPPTNEAAIGVDLDRDGRLGTATRIVFAFAPMNGMTMHWAGRAGAENAHLAAGLYPEGTEFLHSVRYLAPREGGTVTFAPRMKELRYMKKTSWQTYADLEESALEEKKEDSDFPDRTKQLFGTAETGIPTGYGWRIQGFIENARGDLRPQSFEETAFCIGCHGDIGATDDSTFAFPRKLHRDAGAFRDGWYHWDQASYAGVPDLIRADGEGDYAHYLRTNGAGDEFRDNEALIRDWLKGKEIPAEKAATLEGDIAPLILPDANRARRLNAAYRMIVREQSFDKGRDASVHPMDRTVWREVEQDQSTGIEAPEQPWYPRARY